MVPYANKTLLYKKYKCQLDGYYERKYIPSYRNYDGSY